MEVSFYINFIKKKTFMRVCSLGLGILTFKPNLTIHGLTDVVLSRRIKVDDLK